MEKIHVPVKLFDLSGANRRIDENVLRRAIEKYISDNKGQTTLYGQPNPSDYAVRTDITHASHRTDVDTFSLTDDGVECDVEVLDTPNGKIVQELMAYGMHPNFGLRMLGECVYATDENGNQTDEIERIDNLSITSVDIV